jgi:hypothetical protein
MSPTAAPDDPPGDQAVVKPLRDVIRDAHREVMAMTPQELLSARNSGVLDPRVHSQAMAAKAARYLPGRTPPTSPI